MTGFKVDLHCHSCFSHDALSSPRSFARSVKKKGLDAVAITDHNTIRGWKAIEAAVHKEGLFLVRGEEIKVYEQGQKAGEILGLFLNELVSPDSIDVVLDGIRRQDGIAIVAHPFDRYRNPFLFLDQFANQVDGIEVLNARCFFSEFNAKAKAFALSNELGQTAGSDAHIPSEIGVAWTESDAGDLEAFRKDLKKRNTVARGRLSGWWVHFFSSLAKTGWLSPW